MSKPTFEQTLREELVTFFRMDRFTMQPLTGGASARRYFLLEFHGPIYFPESRVALMVIPPDDTAMFDNYVYLDYYLKRQRVPTPSVFEVHRERGWIFVHYQEQPTIEEYLKAYPGAMERVLTGQIDFLVDLQRRCRPEFSCPAFQRRFDVAKYQFEFRFHLEEQLLRFYYEEEPERNLLDPFAARISEGLDVDRPIFVHRDFQSSNLFVCNGENAPQFWLIDFQDARHGNPVYDLVSCLWDSYLPVPDALRRTLMERFFPTLAELGIDWSWAEFERQVDWMVIQRKLHDAGAFAYNFRRIGSPRFLAFLPGAVHMALTVMDRYPEFHPFAEWLSRLDPPPHHLPDGSHARK